MSEMKTKNCCGCKTPKELDNFYRNKLTADGHSSYCIDCTKENSKKYFQRRKEKSLRSQTDNYMKLSMLSNNSQTNMREETENLIRLMKIENLLKTASFELNVFKNHYEKTKKLITI